MQCSQASFYFPPPRSPAEITKKETEAAERETWRQRIERSARGSDTGSVSAQEPTKNVTLELLKPRRMRPLFIRLQQSAKGPKNVSSRNGRRLTRAKTRAKTEKRNVDRRGSWEEDEARKSWRKFRQKRMKMEEGNEEREREERAGTREKDVKAAVRCQGRSEKKKKSERFSLCCAGDFGAKEGRGRSKCDATRTCGFRGGCCCCRSQVQVQVQVQGQMRVLVQVPVQRA
ncbi:hypothetical protein V8C43DRAFT_34952 [Trichoderma afarasin]